MGEAEKYLSFHSIPYRHQYVPVEAAFEALRIQRTEDPLTPEQCIVGFFAMCQALQEHCEGMHEEYGGCGHCRYSYYCASGGCLIKAQIQFIPELWDIDALVKLFGGDDG